MKFFASAHKDSFLVMQLALEEEGFQRTNKPNKADMVFLDHEAHGNLKKWEFFDELAKVKPVFLYPHTPYTPWLWWDYLRPSKNVSCNFAPSEAYKLTLEANGYPCRAENVGFTKPLRVKPFRPTEGRRLAFVPPRLIGANGAFPDQYQRELMEEALDWIVNNRHFFEEVTIFYTFDMEKSYLSKYQGKRFDFVCVGSDGPEVKQLDTEYCLEQLRGVDFLIGCHTVGFVAISQGIPTVLYGHGDEILNFLSPGFDHKYVRFPLSLKEITGKQALKLCREPDHEVEEWKRMNIGRNFNKKKFLEIVKEYL